MAHAESQGEVTIAELAALTGIAEATLRIWEARHGAPRPRRLPNGHRRYSRTEVELICATVEHRKAGLSVAAALACARSAVAKPAPESVFAALREARPEVIPQAMASRTLARVSRAIEDECLSRAAPGLLIGAFQRVPFYRQSEHRWRELATNMEVTIALADFDRRTTVSGAPNEVPFGPDSPLRREWGLITPTGCLCARELPGREARNPTRMFDAIWSPEPEVVHRAARIAIAMLGEDPLADRASAALGPAPPPASPELRRAVALCNRIVGYLAPAAVTP